MNEILYPYHLAPGETGNETRCDHCNSYTNCEDVEGENLCQSCIDDLPVEEIQLIAKELNEMIEDYQCRFHFSTSKLSITLHNVQTFDKEILNGYTVEEFGREFEDLFQPTGLKYTYKYIL